MARCARRMRSSTSDLLRIVGPNTSFRACPKGWPCASVVKRRETTHCQDFFEYESRHSVGHLVKVMHDLGQSRIEYMAIPPGACASGSGKCDAGDRFDEGRFSRTLIAYNRNLGQINIHLDTNKELSSGHNAKKCGQVEPCAMKLIDKVQCLAPRLV